MALDEKSSLLCARVVHLSGASGEALFLGKLWPQRLTFAQLKHMLHEHDVPLPLARSFADDHTLTDSEMCQAFGLSGCVSLDADTGEGADYQYDLNCTDPPSELVDRFDIIFNFGTLEHVFNVPAALLSIHKMLRVGGVVYHSAPSNNYMDHGFYQLCPTLFLDYYERNGYDIVDCALMHHEPGAPRVRQLYAYATRDKPVDHFYGKLGKELVATLFTARKTAQATGHLAPVQLRYQR